MSSSILEPTLCLSCKVGKMLKYTLDMHETNDKLVMVVFRDNI